VLPPDTGPGPLGAGDWLFVALIRAVDSAVPIGSS